MALFDRLEGPPLPPRFADIRWLGIGVLGREFSGVGIGVTSVEVPLLYEAFCSPTYNPYQPPAPIGLYPCAYPEPAQGVEAVDHQFHCQSSKGELYRRGQLGVLFGKFYLLNPPLLLIAGQSSHQIRIQQRLYKVSLIGLCRGPRISIEYYSTVCQSRRDAIEIGRQPAETAQSAEAYSKSLGA